MKKLLYTIVFISISLTVVSQDDYVKATVERNNEFAIDFYKEFNIRGENTIVSPFGVSNCMAMAYIGSEGNTQVQIAKTMNFITPFGVLYSFKQLIKRFQTYKSKNVNLLIGNALWINQDIVPDLKYKNLLKVNFLAHVQSLNFKDNDKKSVKLVNRWAKKTSNYNIRNLADLRTFEKNASLIYTNIVYLNGEWENPFNEEFTSKDDFFLPDSSVRKIDFMNQTSYLKYNENDIFQIVELPYSGKNISLIIILPKQLNYIDSIEQSLNPLNFDFWTSELYTKLVSVSLPKFRSEFRQDVSYAISDMDCQLPFTEQADFSRISSQKTHISGIIQHTVIEIEENKSSRLTELYINPKERDVAGTDFIRFNANRPFIYIVVDNLNKSILIMGKVVSPNFDMISAQMESSY